MLEVISPIFFPSSFIVFPLIATPFSIRIPHVLISLLAFFNASRPIKSFSRSDFVEAAQTTWDGKITAGYDLCEIEF